ncbi:hypothetical protein RI367_000313 [Sorochytrium milnesiophthora]
MQQLVLVFVLALVAAPLVDAAFPPSGVWCPAGGCPQPPKARIDDLLTIERDAYGTAPARCGDGVCNIVAGETCRTCPQDCRKCTLTSAIQSCRNPRHLALTFDDGPSQYSSQLVDILAQVNVKAAFFVNGVHIYGTPNYAAATKKAYDAGHTIGTHTYLHRGLDTGQLPNVRKNTVMTMDNLRLEMLYNDIAIESVIGRRPRFFRPPFLETSPATLAALETMGYYAVSIDVDTNDWQDETSQPLPNKVLSSFKSALAGANKGVGHISLQHDTLDFSIQSVKDIVAFVRGRGMDLVPLSVCLGMPDTAAYRQAGESWLVNAQLARSASNNPAPQPSLSNGTSQAATSTAAAPPAISTGAGQVAPDQGSGSGNKDNSNGVDRLQYSSIAVMASAMTLVLLM